LRLLQNIIIPINKVYIDHPANHPTLQQQHQITNLRADCPHQSSHN
jgi:hypothetical protein